MSDPQPNPDPETEPVAEPVEKKVFTFFPDTTVLINYGLIGRLALLDMFENRRWGYTVSEECVDQYRRHSITTYTQAQALFGSPLMPNQKESTDTQVLRNNLANPTDPPDRHMGEAETIILATNGTYDRAVFLTDDDKAAKAARSHGITAATTWDVLKIAVRQKRLSETDAWVDAKTLRRNKRGWPKGVGHTHADFIAWLTGRSIT